MTVEDESSTARRSPIPTGGSRTARRRDARLDRGTERADRSVSRGRHRRARAIRARLDELLAIGALGAPTPAHGRYFYQRRDGRQNQPVLYVREGVDGADRVADRSQRARCRRARRRSTGAIPARMGACWPTGCPRTAASRACCTCWTSRPAASAAGPDPPYPRGGPRLAPGRQRLLLHPLSRARRRCPRARSTITAPCISTGSAPTRPATRWSSSPAQKEHWPGVGLSPDGRWLRHRRRPHLRPDRSLPAGPSIAGTPPVPVAEDLPALFDGEVARRPALPPDQPRRARPTACTGRSRSGPRVSSWREIVPPRPMRCWTACRDRGPTGWRSSYLERATSRLRLAELDGTPCARSRCPTLGSLFGARGRVGRRRAVLRLLVLHGAAERLPDRPADRGSRRSGGGSRPTSTPSDSRCGRWRIRRKDGTADHDVRGAPPRAACATGTTRRISPATAGSTSA